MVDIPVYKLVGRLVEVVNQAEETVSAGSASSKTPEVNPLVGATGADVEGIGFAVDDVDSFVEEGTTDGGTTLVIKDNTVDLDIVRIVISIDVLGTEEVVKVDDAVGDEVAVGCDVVVVDDVVAVGRDVMVADDVVVVGLDVVVVDDVIAVGRDVVVDDDVVVVGRDVVVADDVVVVGRDVMVADDVVVVLVVVVGDDVVAVGCDVLMTDDVVVVGRDVATFTVVLSVEAPLGLVDIAENQMYKSESRQVTRLTRVILSCIK